MSGRCNTGSKAALAQGGNMSEEEGRWANVMQVSDLSCQCRPFPLALPWLCEVLMSRFRQDHDTGNTCIAEASR